MNSLRPKWTAVLVAALAAMPAFAQYGRHGMLRGADDRDAAPPMQRYYERREGGQDPAGQGARMSSEERRQLRRDIHDAGRELYRPHGRRALRADGTAPAESR